MPPRYINRPPSRRYASIASSIAPDQYSGCDPVMITLYGLSSSTPSPCKSWSVITSYACPSDSSQSTRCKSALSWCGLPCPRANPTE